ncbi:MAG: hypothetical protein ACPG4Z_08165 [Chitinophagales bacterium]
MENSTNWREKLAHSLFEKVKDIDSIAAFFIGGSVALDVVDDFSDLELCIVWNENSTDKHVTMIRQIWDIKSIHLKKTTLDNNTIQIEDSVRLQDFPIDIFHTSIQYIETIFRKVFVEFDTNFQHSNFLFVIQHAKVLKGDLLLQKWKNQLTVYPQQLAIKSIEKRIEPFFGADGMLMAKRKNWILFYNLMTAYQKLIFLALLSVNEMYFPTYKRIIYSLTKMELKPRGIIEFYEEFQQMKPEEAWQELTRIKQETIVIINQKHPEIKTKHLLEKEKFNRKQFTNNIFESNT